MAEKNKKVNAEEKAQRQKVQAERIEARSMKARERGAHVLIPKNPEIKAMVQNLEQLNNLYEQFKQSMGPFGRISEEDSREIQLLMQKICFSMADAGVALTRTLPNNAKFFIPRVMEKAYKAYSEAGEGETAVATAV